MCDAGDLGTHIEPVENKSFGQPSVVLYDQVPAGIAFSEKLFEMHDARLADIAPGKDAHRPRTFASGQWAECRRHDDGLELCGRFRGLGSRDGCQQQGKQ